MRASSLASASLSVRSNEWFTAQSEISDDRRERFGDDLLTFSAQSAIDDPDVAPNEIPDEGRGARPELTRDSSAQDIELAYGQQQRHWQVKYFTDQDFRRDIDRCGQVQEQLFRAIEGNRLSAAEIRTAAAAWATEFLKALGMVRSQGGDIAWDRAYVDAFGIGAEHYTRNSRQQFLFNQAGPIAIDLLCVALELAKLFTPSPVVDGIKAGAKIIQLPWQIYATFYGLLFSARDQPEGVKHLEMQGPYIPNVSSIDYSRFEKGSGGKPTQTSVAYPRKEDMQWRLDLISKSRTAISDVYATEDMHQELKRIEFDLNARKTDLEGITHRTGRQNEDLRIAGERLQLVRALINELEARGRNSLSEEFSHIEGKIQEQLALSRIVESFNAGRHQGDVKASRAKLFALQAVPSLTKAGTHLGHCIPVVVSNATTPIINATAGLLPLAQNITVAAGTVVEQCTGFNPWGLALDVFNLSVKLVNVGRYWWNLPGACEADYERKMEAYTAALALLPHGRMCDEDGKVVPGRLDAMLKSGMFRVLDAAAKTLTDDLNCSTAALVSQVLDLKANNERFPYRRLATEFLSLKTESERKKFMLTPLRKSNKPERRQKVKRLLGIHESTLAAIGMIKRGEIAALLTSKDIPDTSHALLRSGLVAAAGGNVDQVDSSNWDELIAKFGAVERRSFKTDQETYKLGIGLCRIYAGTSGITGLKSLFDALGAAFQFGSNIEHDTMDIIAHSIQIASGVTALSGAVVSYLVAYCYWQFILEKNRQRQEQQNEKFSPPNSSVLNPDSRCYISRLNPDRLDGVVRNFTTLLSHPIPDDCINWNNRLCYEGNSTFWTNLWRQIHVVNFDLSLFNVCSRIKEIIHPDETRLDLYAEEVNDILCGAMDEIHNRLQEHLQRSLTTRIPSPTTTTQLPENFLADLV